MAWQRKQLVGGLAAVAACALGTVMLWRSSPEQLPPSTDPRETVAVASPPPKVSASPFLNTGPKASYVGSSTCSSCHPQQADTYRQTRHSRSMATIAAANDLPDARIVHADSGYTYETESVGGVLHHREEIQLGETSTEVRDAPLTYVVGSGEFGHSFLAEIDGFLVQSPLTWYSTRSCWDMSPGFDHPGQLSFRRAVSAGCLYCHAGVVDIQEKNAFRVRVDEAAIGCERCHGPGSIHVAVRESGESTVATGAIDHTIVNPARLPRELSEAVCQQCHLQGDAQITVRGRQFDGFRPGLSLEEFRQDYRLASKDHMTIVGHVEQLHLSRCYQQSQTLTCITCHDLHATWAPDERKGHYRQACLKCHRGDSCTESLAVRLEQADDHCTDCHMPAAPTEVPHVAFTHHRIGIHGGNQKETGPLSESGTGRIVAMLSDDALPKADADRCRGLAWLQLLLSNPNVDRTTAFRSAQESLQRAWDGGAQDAAVAAGLATIAKEIQWNEMAEDWAQRALQLDPTPSDAHVSALEILSEIQFRNRAYDKALAGFTELTELRRDARHWFFRGLTAQNLDRTEEAIRTLHHSIAINPMNLGAHTALAAIYHMQGNRDRERYHQQAADQLKQHAVGVRDQ